MTVSRRDLLRNGTAAVGALAAGAALPATTATAAPNAAGMRTRQLGKTGLTVSEIGFGGYPIDDPEVLRYAVSRGITYVDTAHCYRGGRSEETIGEALAGGLRKRVVLVTKWCPHHIGKQPRKQVFIDMLDKSLKRLRTDHVDVLLNHEVGRNSDGEGKGRLANPELYEAWEVVHKAGKARFMGLSGHDGDLMDIMHTAAASGKFSVMLCRYSFMDYPDQQKLIDRAHAAGIGFVAMKTLAGAKGADLDRFRDRHTSFKQAALKWVLGNAKVSNLIISINSKRQVDDYAGASGKALTAQDDDVLRDYAATFSAELCRFCNACQPACPDDVRIADVLRFAMYNDAYSQEARAVESYAQLLKAERAAHCEHCAGHCESACGYDLPVKRLLLEAHAKLDRGGDVVARSAELPPGARGGEGG